MLYERNLCHLTSRLPGSLHIEIAVLGPVSKEDTAELVPETFHIFNLLYRYPPGLQRVYVLARECACSERPVYETCMVAP